MDEIAHLITEKNDPEEVYQLLDILGQGAYGSVSKALHKQTGQLFAIKILPTTSGVQIAAIKKEIGILKQCNDDHIVKYYGSYFKDNNLWIVMEYCIAGSVADIVQITKKKFNEHQIASILESVLMGLAYLHARKKIHRDIKAANILLDQKGNAKLADFGVSASSMHTNARFRTHIGSPYWMSPEIIKFSEYTYKTDIWSLGVTAIELAQGQVPNSHIKPFMAIFMIKSNPVQSLKDPSQWSPQFNDFVKQCLQINPSNRPEAKQLIEHAFIKKYSRGQRLLSQLVLSSIQQIEEFRMNQSANSSFAQIIIDEAREYNDAAKTLIEGNSIIQHKQQSQSSESEPIQQAQGEGSMIIIQSHRSQNSCASMVAYDNSMVEYKDGEDNSKRMADPLTSYINGLKQETNAEAKCIDRLTEALNKYDQQLNSQLEQVFKKYKLKAMASVKGLEDLQRKNSNLKLQQYSCRLKQCQSVRQFLFNQSKTNSQSKINNLFINSRVRMTAGSPSQQKIMEVKYTESTNKSRDEPVKKQDQFRDKIKSFIIPNNDSGAIQPQYYNFKKSYTQTQQENIQQSRGNFQPVQSNLHKNAHNSSRIMIKRADQYNIASSQVKEFVSDADVYKYLVQKNYLNNINNNQNQTSMAHTKSAFQPVYTSTSINSRTFLRQQKSAEKSKSKSKNKAVKSGKVKKLKTKN